LRISSHPIVGIAGRKQWRLLKEDFRQFFLALHKQRGLSRSTATVAIAAFKFLFEHTLQRPWPRLDLFRPCPVQTLPVILSVDEVWRILSHLEQPTYYTCLATIYTCGLRISEGVNLQVSWIDSARIQLLIRGGKGFKDRYIPLPARMLTLLRRHWRTHRNPVWLFPALPRAGMDPHTATAPMIATKLACWASCRPGRARCATILTFTIWCHPLRWHQMARAGWSGSRTFWCKSNPRCAVSDEVPHGVASDAVGGPSQRACLGQVTGRRLPAGWKWGECLEVSRTVHLPHRTEQQSHRCGRKWGGHLSLHRGQNRYAETGHATCRHLHRTVSCARAAERLCESPLLRVAVGREAAPAGRGTECTGAPAGSSPATACGRSPRIARRGTRCPSLPVVRTADAASRDAATAATLSGGGDEGA
jgi:integrase-like protein